MNCLTLIYLIITSIVSTVRAIDGSAENLKNICMTESLLIGFKEDFTVILDSGGYCITMDECIEKLCQLNNFTDVVWAGFSSDWQD